MLHIIKIPASLIRGGTSKGIFFQEKDLPKASDQRDELLLSIMGSPDPTGMQLNGVGGGLSSTSKVALISKSSRPDIDVDYLFGQVSLTKPEIDWDGSCGNLAAAVGLFAMNEGLIQAEKDGSAHIRVWQVNLGYKIHLSIPSDDESTFISIPGVPGKRVPIYVEFIDPSGGQSLLPDGKPVHLLTLPSQKQIETTLILGANPTIFVRAVDLNLSGKELPEQVDFKKLEPLIQHLSLQAAAIMKIPCNAALRVAWVSSSADHVTSDGVKIYKNEAAIMSRISTEGRVHHAYTGTGVINLSCAAKIPGTIPFQTVQEAGLGTNSNSPVAIAHPTGVMLVNAKVSCDPVSKKWIAESSGFIRTAKIIFVGNAYV